MSYAPVYKTRAREVAKHNTEALAWMVSLNTKHGLCTKHDILKKTSKSGPSGAAVTKHKIKSGSYGAMHKTRYA